jgi:hypothetical protein
MAARSAEVDNAGVSTMAGDTGGLVGRAGFMNELQLKAGELALTGSVHH